MSLRVAILGCSERGSTKAMDLGDESVSLESQLRERAGIGVVVNEGVTEADLTVFEDRGELESEPYRALVEVMGETIDREPNSPIANRLWMCDAERVEDHGAYRDVLLRSSR